MHVSAALLQLSTENLDSAGRAELVGGVPWLHELLTHMSQQGLLDTDKMYTSAQLLNAVSYSIEAQEEQRAQE